MNAIPIRVCHCGRPVEPRDPDPWEGRMDDYCYDCATCRCDTADAVCPHATRNRVQAQDSLTHQIHRVIAAANQAGEYDAADWIRRTYYGRNTNV